MKSHARLGRFVEKGSDHCVFKQGAVEPTTAKSALRTHCQFILESFPAIEVFSFSFLEQNRKREQNTTRHEEQTKFVRVSIRLARQGARDYRNKPARNEGTRRHVTQPPPICEATAMTVPLHLKS